MAWCLPRLRGSSLHQQQQPCGSASGHAQRVAKLLTTAGFEPSEVLPRVNADLWQDTLRERFGMLECLQPVFQGEAHLSSALAAVRFVAVACRMAASTSPKGSSRPERVALLLQLLPALVATTRAEEAVRGARALVLAVRREWVTADDAGGVNGNGSLSTAEKQAIVDAITKHVAAGFLGEPCVPPGSAAAPGGGAIATSLAPPTEALPFPLDPGAAQSQSVSPSHIADIWSPRSAADDASTQTEEGGLNLEDVEDVPLSDGNQTTSTDEILLQCLSCGNPILRADDILSSSYRIMTGPAYLTSSAYNVQLSSESHEAMYTSGQYTVCDVTCARCSARLGIMYTGAADAPNHYKVGKFLMGQDQLLFPPTGALVPHDLQALRRQMLELLQHGSSVLGSSSEATLAIGRPRHRSDAARVGMTDDLDPLLAGPPAVAQTRQRIVATIGRYIRCLFPAFRHRTDSAPHLVQL